MRNAVKPLTVTILAAALVACSDAPAPTAVLSVPPTADQVARTHTEFDGHIDAFFYLSCINEQTHWVGSFHVTVDVLQTPTGNTSIRVRGLSDPSTFYVVRANGVRYDMIGQGSTQLHEFVGPVHFVEWVEPKVFRSRDGDVLVTNYQTMITFDEQGNPVSVTANGACP